MPALRTHLLASVATLAAVSGLASLPARAANYGPLPLLSADQINENSTCYLEDANGIIVDLSWICDGGQGNILPNITVKNVGKPKKVTAIAPPTCGTEPEFASCPPPVIEITGGKYLEAVQELNAAPLNPYEHLGIN